ncbi:hypothetical protein AWH69_05085 [Janibacter melonis]|uniref:Uncharacterized protein n=1 Tax=Janibacter melonis TaxID=262209 RepID=A0A176QCU0_9MICO|nr:hypothetical protein AWH69_05085 [Janibacter melonis]
MFIRAIARRANASGSTGAAGPAGGVADQRWYCATYPSTPCRALEVSSALVYTAPPSWVPSQIGWSLAGWGSASLTRQFQALDHQPSAVTQSTVRLPWELVE